MRQEANEWLGEEEAARRDARIAATLACIEGLEQRFTLGIHSPMYANILQPSSPDIVFYDRQPPFDEAWLDKKLDYVEKLLLDQLAKSVLGGIEKRPRNDHLLKGSAASIAEKLCVYRFAGHVSLHEPPADGYEFDCDVKGLRIGLNDLIQEVQERLEKHHMTYRLWDAAALEQLDHYLYYPVRDSELYIEGALFTGVYGRPANLQQFLDGVAAAIAELPRRELTECTFPDDCPEQVRFTDYVPPHNMTAEQIEQLYFNYLKWYEQN